MVYSGNWNEEIDVDGFVIMNKKETMYLSRFLKNFKTPISVSLGFGDYVEYDNGKELLEEISFQEIIPEEYSAITKFFNTSNDFGDNLILSIKEEAEREGIEFKLFE
jgi:(p)ppGpp synthase/HD superfamily hydrolase